MKLFAILLFTSLLRITCESTSNDKHEKVDYKDSLVSIMKSYAKDNAIDLLIDTYNKPTLFFQSLEGKSILVTAYIKDVYRSGDSCILFCTSGSMTTSKSVFYLKTTEEQAARLANLKIRSPIMLSFRLHKLLTEDRKDKNEDGEIVSYKKLEFRGVFIGYKPIEHRYL